MRKPARSATKRPIYGKIRVTFGGLQDAKPRKLTVPKVCNRLCHAATTVVASDGPHDIFDTQGRSSQLSYARDAAGSSEY